MFKGMNNLQATIIKTDIILGLFISLIVMPIFSFKVSMIYLLGIILSILNFVVSAYAISNWLLTSKTKYFVSNFLRIIIISTMIVPFRYDIKLVGAYLFGLITHYFNLVFCTLRKKGSA